MRREISYPMSIRKAVRKLTGRVPGSQVEVVLGEAPDGTRKVSVNLPGDKPYMAYTDDELVSVIIDELCTAYWYLKGEDITDWLNDAE